MLKVSDAIRLIVEDNALLSFGLRERLLNLSQLARYLKSQVEARTKKSLQLSAIVMNLSRLQAEFSNRERTQLPEFRVTNIIVHSNLSAATFPRSQPTHRNINTLSSKIRKQGGYMTMTEGIHELTVIVSNEHLREVMAIADGSDTAIRENIASLAVTFDESYLESPGLFYLIFQQLYFQNLNIIELASTANELVLYLEEKDVRLAFETIYNRFVRQ